MSPAIKFGAIVELWSFIYNDVNTENDQNIVIDQRDKMNISKY